MTHLLSHTYVIPHVNVNGMNSERSELLFLTVVRILSIAKVRLFRFRWECAVKLHVSCFKQELSQNLTQREV